MMETHRSTNKIASHGSQFPASTFPETFKDFFSMINEDEDQVELVSNVLEDKVSGKAFKRLGNLINNKIAFQVIPRYNVRGRNRSSSAKYSNSTSLLPSAGVAVRSNSFRVNRNTSSSQQGLGAAGTVTPDFCKHIKYCCLHQDFNSGRLDSETLDRPSRNQEYSDGRVISLGSQFKFSDTNTNNYSNFSDDEKSMKFNKKFSADANIYVNPSSIHNKSLQQNYDSFENRKCNCGKLLCKCLHTSYGWRGFAFPFQMMINEYERFHHFHQLDSKGNFISISARSVYFSHSHQSSQSRRDSEIPTQ